MPDRRGVKLRAPEGDINYAVKALGALNRRATLTKVLGESIPHDQGFPVSKGHLQGVTIKDTSAILTTSSDNGRIIIAHQHEKDFEFENDIDVVDNDHPGGSQAIGDYVALPVYKQKSEDDSATIQIYDILNMTLVKQFPTGKRRAYCVGITHLNSQNGGFYLLAVGVNSKGDKMHFYRTANDKPFNDDDCNFEECGEWEFHDVTYPNSISLISDEAGNAYFLGLHTSGRLASLGFGKDWVDLYRIGLKESRGVELTKISKLHVKCTTGGSAGRPFLGHVRSYFRPAFRWGGSALVSSPTAIKLFACERNVRKDGKQIKLNIFSQT